MNKLIIVADSGSSKTDWVVIDENGQQLEKIRTIGFNPYFQSSELIFSEIEKGFQHFTARLDDVVEIFFYGSGCSSEEKNQIVIDALTPIFRHADVQIHHDLEAAAVATLGDKSGIACIIGTGSNSCVWEHNSVINNIPSHGFIFGDEASGSYLGIQLLKLYLSGNLEKSLSDSFENTYKFSQNQLLNATYREPSPNVFLAKFALFYSQHQESGVLRSIIYDGFCNFFDVRIVPYPDYKSYKLGFVGSIAYYFKPILEEVAHKYGMEIEQIVQCPIDNLVAYHKPKKSLHK
jgi:glucosamine kinase